MRDKNLLGQDQLRYIDCQHKPTPQISRVDKLIQRNPRSRPCNMCKDHKCIFLCNLLDNGFPTTWFCDFHFQQNMLELARWRVWPHSQM